VLTFRFIGSATGQIPAPPSPLATYSWRRTPRFAFDAEPQMWPFETPHQHDRPNLPRAVQHGTLQVGSTRTPAATGGSRRFLPPSHPSKATTSASRLDTPTTCGQPPRSPRPQSADSKRGPSVLVTPPPPRRASCVGEPAHSHTQVERRVASAPCRSSRRASAVGTRGGTTTTSAVGSRGGIARQAAFDEAAVTSRRALRRRRSR